MTADLRRTDPDQSRRELDLIGACEGAGPLRRRTSRGSTTARLISGLGAALLLPAVGLSAEPYESAATLDAGSTLADMPMSGRGWRIEQAVRSDGRMNHYRMSTRRTRA